MNKVDHKQVSGDGGKPLSNELQYMPGFGNDFETEALPGALPQGMNSPQKCNYGLYGEQLSGTAFTAPSHQNERTGATASARRSSIRGRFGRSICPTGKARRMCPRTSSRSASTAGTRCRIPMSR
jgi:hypothetical protein